MTNCNDTYPGYRFPIEIISHTIWLYHRFMLSLRDVSEILLSRGIEVSHKSIRDWGLTFGPAFAQGIKKRAPKRGDKWDLDEMYVVMNGKKHWLFRALTRTVMNWIFWCKSNEIKKRLSDFLKNC